MKIVILCTDDAIYQYSWSDYMEYNRNVRFRSKMLLSLSCSQDKILLTDYLNKSLIEEALRNDEITPIFAAIARNPIAFDLITNFLNDNIKTIYNR